ncbi:MAG TPA: helix-turn-helix domain-containing protein, partial [Aldersonia sp.]
MSDLGIFGVLGVPEAAGRAVDFVERTLAPLLEYDAAHDGRLVATLATYLAAGRSRSQAAAELHVHVNTIGSRLTRIGALLGDDWSSVERVLGLQMALQLLPLLSDNQSDVS